MNNKRFINARAADGSPLSFEVKEGRFAAFGADLPDNAASDSLIDLQGRLVLPGLVDGHIHLDKSFLGGEWQPHQPVSSLRERLAVEKALLAQAQPVEERASMLIEQAISWGTVAMRSHVDVDATTGLTNLHAVMAAREQWRDKVAIQLVAFPQAGVISCPGSAAVLESAVKEGVEVIGGIDPTTLDGDANGQLDILFNLAARYGVRMDIHLHEPANQGAQQLQRIADRTQALGLAGRVAVSHAYALGDVSPSVLEQTARSLADAGVAIMTNAPGDHAFPPILTLRAAGVRVFAGNDNIRDAWWPYGNGDMLQRAMLIGYRSGFNTDEELNVALEMATTAAAEVLGVDGYGLAPGNEANFIVIDAPNSAAAVAMTPSAREIYRRGEKLEVRRYG
ncbi:amidohydrolase family protein [Paramixta manurensis]|uniref:Amidohydrolase family protein n=1 Tax=Paramixta manurensis TaxID=2740817 RepID=A0A6M8UD66_9GAMM|nr:amidohydrolase family protein [Erwiniaceae bacterium PD-1]